jgi:peptidoglycan/xylan/chitin deacetylase (PgdA/CDA1 family)
MEVSPEILFLTYHKVSPRFEWGLTSVQPHDFYQHIQFLFESGFQSITLEDILDSKLDPKNKVAILFDDSYECIYQYAFPILQKFGFKATVFVISGYVGEENKWDANLGGIRYRHMNWVQLKELSSVNWEIGSHSVSHVALSDLPQNRWMQEVTDSKTRIEKEIGKEVFSFSYPFSKRNQPLDDLLSQCGYRITVCLRPADHSHSNLYQVFSHPVYRFDRIGNLISKKRNRRMEIVKERFISYGSQATVWEKRLLGKSLEIKT